MIRKSMFIIFLIMFQVFQAQDLNSYKYVVVPLKYNFMNEQNQYQLAELTKFLFEKEGFEVYFEGELPEGLKKNNCEGLYTNLEEDSNLFVTRLSISLKNCDNREIFKSEVGKSRIKDFKKGHQDALRKTFKSIAALNYKYIPNENVVEVNAMPQQQEKSVRETAKQTTPEYQSEEKTSVEAVKEPIKISTENKLTFSRENVFYYLEETSSGYTFYQKGMAEPFAALVKSSAGETFIYSSVTSKGVAGFNPKGDLVVEILQNNGELSSKVYRRVAQ